jgi:outer membrane biosynthesis protein TonB
MRSASTAQLTSLFGSVALHACAVLVLVLAARRAQPAPVVDSHERPDAWVGASAVEVDAVATPEATPNIANAASSEESESESAATAANEPAAPAQEATPQPIKANAPVRVEHPPEAIPEPAPRPKPKPAPPEGVRRPRPSKPANPSSGVAAASSPAAADGNHEESTPAATGTFGAPDLPPGVRSLPSAFARAIPPATGADPIWQSLPTGTQKPFILAVEVDAEGHIASAKILGAHDGDESPPQFEHLRQRVIALLGGGLFALQNNGSAGRDLFRITITLSDRAVKEDSGPAELVERGFEPPRGSAPGRAYFTLASGRHFEAKVEVLGAPPRPKRP